MTRRDEVTTGEEWTWDTHCDRTALPATDHDTIVLIDEAVKTLTLFRAGELGDAGATVSCLASLITEADGQLNDAVAAARDQGYTWDQIACRLAATSAAAARRRYRDYVVWKNSRPPDD